MRHLSVQANSTACLPPKHKAIPDYAFPPTGIFDTSIANLYLYLQIQVKGIG